MSIIIVNETFTGIESVSLRLVALIRKSVNRNSNKFVINRKSRANSGNS